ncbi:sulfatase-like hydrolase/transferase, partial [Helicobacter sp. 23-1045]
VNNANLPYAESPLFSYSKTDKNIVVIVLDMFSGSHTPFIFTQFPHLKSALDGFTLFPNAISSGNATMQTMATLIGGEHYAVYNMNKRAQNLAEQIDSAFISTANAFADGGFQTSLLPFVATNIQNIAPKFRSEVFAISASSRAFDEYYQRRENLLKKNIYRSVLGTQIALLLNFGLFKFAPEYPFRAKIYRDVDGWMVDSAKQRTLNAMSAISYSASFYAFTQNLRVDSAKPTFKFIHSMITHYPLARYFDGRSCDFFSAKTAWDDFPHTAQMNYESAMDARDSYQHYDTEACALHYLRDFVKNLKNAGIYDNTQILVVSDHGGYDAINMPSGNADVLFLFKDFGVRGELKVDKRLMANFDIVSIFCANLKGGCPNVPPNILQNYPQNRELLHTILYSWRLEQNEANRWIISDVLKVRGDIYKAENWEFVNMK